MDSSPPSHPFSPLLGKQVGNEQRSQRSEATWVLGNPTLQCRQNSNLTPVCAGIIQVPTSPRKSCLYFPPFLTPPWGLL